MDSEDPSPLNPLQAPFCGNLINRLTQEHATLSPNKIAARFYLPFRRHLAFGCNLPFGRYYACGCH
jgi:hypothetical protein